MKNLINSLSILVFAILGITTFTSCDPCSTVVCPANSVCNTGSCACNAGYDKIGATCTGANIGYGNGTISVREMAVSGLATVYDTTGVIYTITPSPTDPLSFTLENFLNDSANDVIFTVSSTNHDVISTATVTTAAGYSYYLSGAKTGSQVALDLYRAGNSTTYSIGYTL